MPRMIQGSVTDLGLVAARPVFALKANHAIEAELGRFISRNVSGDDGIYVLGLGNYLDNVAVVALDIDAPPRSQPDAIDWKTSVDIDDHLTEVLVDLPLGFWRLFETSGSSAADSSGNVKDGSYIGAVPGNPSLTPSGEGFSASFADDAVSRVMVPSVLAQTASPDLSFECWYTSTVSTRIMDIWDRASVGIPSNRFWVSLNKQGANYAAGYITVSFQGPGASMSTVVTTNPNWRLTDGAAHHLTVTKTGSAVEVYFDGAWQETLGEVEVSGPYHNGQMHYIGCTAGFLAGSKFEGRISEVAFYDTGLPQTRVWEHFASSF